MKYLSLSALIAAGALASSVSMANAADLGGNCCADLEERIAELEVTTARKGNRKVSLTVSGWVAEQVIAWDDGVETNVYQTGVGGTLDSNFRFTGSAKISPDLSAGFVLHIEASSAANLAVNQRQDDPAGAGLSILQSFWFLKSESLGRISVGQQSSAYDNVAVLPDGSGSLIQANYIMYDVNNFTIRRNGQRVENAAGTNVVNWGSLATCGSAGGTTGLAADCDGVPNNNVRYDTPTFMGFSASASWGEDDVWGVAGRYAGEFSGFKLAAAVGYYENSDDNLDAVVVARGGKNSAAFQAGAYIQHIPTGLFVYGAYGQDLNDVTGGTFAGQQQIDGDNYYVKAGIRQKFTPYGATVLFGEYGQNSDKLSNALWLAGVNSSNLEQYGVGLVQEIDAAAMSLFVVYRHYEGDVSCRGTAVQCGGQGLAVGSNSFDEHQLVKMGAIINF